MNKSVISALIGLLFLTLSVPVLGSSFGNDPSIVAAYDLSAAKNLCRNKKYDTAYGPVSICTGGCWGPRYRYKCKNDPRPVPKLEPISGPSYHYVGLTSHKTIKGKTPYQRAVKKCKKIKPSFKKAKLIASTRKCGKPNKIKRCYICKR